MYMSNTPEVYLFSYLEIVHDAQFFYSEMIFKLREKQTQLVPQPHDPHESSVKKTTRKNQGKARSNSE